MPGSGDKVPVHVPAERKLAYLLVSQGVLAVFLQEAGDPKEERTKRKQNK